MEYVVLFNGIVANEAPATSQVRRWLLGDEEDDRGRGRLFHIGGFSPVKPAHS